MNYKHLSKSKLESSILYIVLLHIDWDIIHNKLDWNFSFRFTLSTLHHIHLTTEQIKNNKLLSQKEFSIISQQNLFKIFWKICILHNVTCTRTEESKINKKNSDSYISIRCISVSASNIHHTTVLCLTFLCCEKC